MKRKTVNKLLSVALSAALCMPLFFADPLSATAQTVSGGTVSGSTPGESSGGVSSNGTSSSEASSSGTASSGASSSGAASQPAAAATSANTIVIGKSRITSTVGGVFSATAVSGTVITTPKENLAASIGLSESEIKAGTNVRSYVCDNRNKASKAALQSAAETAGKTVAGYVNMDLYTITKKGVVTKITTASEPVSITFALPARLVKTNNSFSILAFDKDGKAVIMNDVDTDARTITIETKVFGAYSIVY